MNKDQVKGTLTAVVGKVQESTGKAIGSNDLQITGIKKQVQGRVQKAVGDIKTFAKRAGSK